MELSRAKLEATLIRRAWESEEFKQKLFTDPKKAIADLGYTLPENMEISVVEEHRNKMIFVLPPNPLGSMQEFMPTNVNPTGPEAITHACYPPSTLTQDIQCQVKTKDCSTTTECLKPTTQSHDCKVTLPPGPASPQPKK